MTRWVAILCLVMLLHGFVAAQDVTPDMIDNAIRKGRDYILKEQTPAGDWETPVGVNDWSAKAPAGRTALVTLALITVGEKANSDKITNAINFLRNYNAENIYVVGVRSCVFSALPATKENKLVRLHDLNFLLSSTWRDRANTGLYGYFPMSSKFYNYPHTSTSNYGVLGVWALADTGLEVPIGYWDVVDGAWRRIQRQTGAWGYRPTDKSAPDPEHKDSASMTTAGVATLLITQDFRRQGILKGNLKDPSIDAGMAWLIANWDKIHEPYGGAGDSTRMDYYTYYNLERIGIASGLRTFGSVDWYADGAKYILKTQRPDGSWGGLPTHPAVDTSFAMMFLAHGKSPVIMNKLEYKILPKGAKEPVTGPWNQRSRDCANLSLWMKRELERDVRWQRIDLNASVTDLLEAPILYIAGDNPLTFTDSEVAKLREFCLAGGMILGSADDGNKDFSNSFRKLGSQLFPIYEFRKLGDDHPILSGRSDSKNWKRKLTVEALGNGSREMMVLVPDGDIPKAWQQRQFSFRAESFDLAANIYLYSIDNDGSWERGRGFYVPAVTTAVPKTVKIARIQYNGKWDPEPFGWKRLDNILKRDQKVGLDIQTVKLGDGKLTTYKFAHLTGTADFTLDDASRNELKSFVTNGGTLLIDACGGSTLFSQSVQAELQKIFGDSVRQFDTRLKLTDPLFTQWGPKIEKIEYRPYGIQKGLINDLNPSIRIMNINNRPAIILSNEDLSTGLVGLKVGGITGYQPDIATQIVRNIVLKFAE